MALIKTNKEIKYRVAPYGHIGTIPKGTEVSLSSNLPNHRHNPKYWAKPWKGMTEKEESWQRNYGFLIEKEDV
jgi:hypothetical protein